MANLGRLAVAMLGVLAYQNRDKIGELLRGNRDPNNPQGGVLEQISKGLSGTSLGDIIDRSWISPGPNQPIEPGEVEAAIDDETLASLSMQTGLSRQELISRITRDLPEAINKLTPNGVLPPVDAEDVSLLDPVSPRTER